MSAPISSLAASIELNSGNSPLHSLSTILIGDTPTAGVEISPRNRARTSVERHGAAIVFKEDTDLFVGRSRRDCPFSHGV